MTTIRVYMKKGGSVDYRDTRYFVTRKNLCLFKITGSAEGQKAYKKIRWSLIRKKKPRFKVI